MKIIDWNEGLYSDPTSQWTKNPSLPQQKQGARKKRETSPTETSHKAYRYDYKQGNEHTFTFYGCSNSNVILRVQSSINIDRADPIFHHTWDHVTSRGICGHSMTVNLVISTFRLFVLEPWLTTWFRLLNIQSEHGTDRGEKQQKERKQYIDRYSIWLFFSFMKTGRKWWRKNGKR